MTLKKLSKISDKVFSEKRVFLRADLNIPLENKIILQDSNSINEHIVFCETIKYPNYKAVIPTKETIPISDIGINLDLIILINKCLKGFDDNMNRYKFSFYGTNKAIILTHEISNTKILIMPYIL